MASFALKKSLFFFSKNVLQRLVLNSPKWGLKELDTTERLNWTELKWSFNYEQKWVAFHPNANVAMFSDVAVDSITQMWTLACLNEVLSWGLM